MEEFLRFATNLPIAFGLLITVAVFLLSIASFLLGMVFPAGKYKPHIGQILGRLISTLVFIFILAGFDWLMAAGLVRFAAWQSWLPILLWLAYETVTAIYAYFGDFRFDLSKPKLAGVVALNQMTIGLIEETAYRGIILYAFVRLWGDTTWGLIGSVLLTSVLFGASHLIWMVFGKPPLQTVLMSLSAFEAGIFYGAITLASGSVWPAVVCHGLVNAVVNIKLIDHPNYKETVSSDIKIVLLNLPVVIYSLYLVWTMSPFTTIPNVP